MSAKGSWKVACPISVKEWKFWGWLFLADFFLQTFFWQTFGAGFTAGDQISNYQHNWTQTTSFSCKLSGFCSSAPFCSAVEVNWVQFRWIGLRLNEWLSINCLEDYKHFQNAFHVYFLFSSSILNFWSRHLVCCCLFRKKKIRFAAS